MGRKRKFGEESGFVSVHVPKSKRKDYRSAIKNFVEKKFANESDDNEENAKIKANKENLTGFRKIEEFVKNIKNADKEEDDFRQKNKDK